jgi:hypothetical protein
MDSDSSMVLVEFELVSAGAGECAGTWTWTWVRRASEIVRLMLDTSHREKDAWCSMDVGEPIWDRGEVGCGMYDAARGCVGVKEVRWVGMRKVDICGLFGIIRTMRLCHSRTLLVSTSLPFTPGWCNHTSNMSGFLVVWLVGGSAHVPSRIIRRICLLRMNERRKIMDMTLTTKVTVTIRQC